MTYELVVGLETHIELSTSTKIFCSCRTDFGGEPNTHCCPICTGMPGTLPKLNKEALRLAIIAGLATHCEISKVSKMDRKNYMYPDLPKAYQISQYDMPLCKNGYIELDNGRKIRIARIHLEEDAGKLVHKSSEIFIDYNRGGVPLIEVVTEPDIRSSDEAKEYVEKLQLAMRYTGVSDCRMQEGSMRCDVNVSVKKDGSSTLGTRAEIKNMNSVAFMVKAIEYEKSRQIDILQSGGKVLQETLRYNEERGITESMRGKENAQDYRYFREPDLVTINISDAEINEIKEEIPELPDIRLKKYVDELGIPKGDAELIIRYKKAADFFENEIKGLKKPRIISNFIIGQIFGYIEGEASREEFSIKIPPGQLNKLAALVENGKVNMNIAKSKLLTMLETGKSINDLISQEDMAGLDDDELKRVCKEAIENNKNAVLDYINGKQKALKAILGSVMKATKGKANPEAAEKTLIELIDIK